ncbi:MAG: hypothetical protein CVU61_06550 [Deltaproteobacteria bacterium HGW-Deltaproteobacteria-19]|jgi:hypothetical protein|nr:MAG: hypothetical protein CVU61_06550 [Deltaproteobacteria bacterium HGW-Deltaproteobacteria-19]
MIPFLAAAAAVFFVLVFIEAAYRFLACRPDLLKKCPQGIINSVGHLYVQGGERRVMQFLPNCGRHDTDLGYTLKPGTFTYSGREFSNRYEINSLGVRDDEESLEAPEIVVAGDSFAVGWGVDREDMFSQILERETGLDVLNTAIPSYGTVREMMILRKIPRERMKFLIIQYCHDDYDENLRFRKNGNRLKVMGEESFSRLTAYHSRPNPYFFGKYLWLKAQKRVDEWGARLRKRTSAPPPEADEADLFLHALRHGGVDLSGVRIITFEMNGRHQSNTFTTLLREKLRTGSWPEEIRSMDVLDMTEHLEDRHFYILDDHLKREGHAIVARVVLETMRSKK